MRSICGGKLEGERFYREQSGEGFAKKCAEAVANGVFERRNAERIMAAGEGENFGGNTVVLHGGKKFACEVEGKSRVVACGDGQNFPRGGVKSGNVRKRADGRPIAAKVIERDMRGEALPDV